MDEKIYIDIPNPQNLEEVLKNFGSNPFVKKAIELNVQFDASQNNIKRKQVQLKMLQNLLNYLNSANKEVTKLSHKSRDNNQGELDDIQEMFSETAAYILADSDIKVIPSLKRVIISELFPSLSKNDGPKASAKDFAIAYSHVNIPVELREKYNISSEDISIYTEYLEVYFSKQHNKKLLSQKQHMVIEALKTKIDDDSIGILFDPTSFKAMEILIENSINNN